MMRFPNGIGMALICLILILRVSSVHASQGNNILRFGIHVSAMGNMDPHFAAGSQDRAFADMVFSGILRYQPGNAPKLETDLAEAMPEFRMEKGRQIWTIVLRKGVYFHAGPKTPAYELTADDVIFSLNKSADKEFCAYSGNYLGLILKKTGSHSLEIITPEPVSTVLFFPKLANYGGGFIVSKKAVEAMGYEGFKAHPVGTGPFKFAAHSPGDRVSLAAHREYFRGAPRLDGVEIRFMPDLAVREAALKAGQLDIIMGSGQKRWVRDFEAVPGIAIDTAGVGEVGTIHFNTRMPPLDDIRVRKAVAYALGRSDFLNTTSSRISGKVFSPVPHAFLPGGISEREADFLGLTYDKNLTKARELLAETGYPDGFALDLVSSEKRIYRLAYQTLRDQLEPIGIQCRVAVVTHSEMHRTIRKSPRPITIYYAWRPNADAYLTRFFHSDSIVITGTRPDTNFSHYNRIDRLIEAARAETDPKAQVNLWVQSQIRILDDMAALPVMYIKNCYARTSRLDYGHVLASSMALYPQFTETTLLSRSPPK